MMRFIKRMLFGIALILVVNECFLMKGIETGVGINLISMMMAGIFGLPGTALLYVVGMY